MTEHNEKNQLVAILPKQGHLTKVAWELPDILTEQDWITAGRALYQIDGALNWWLGDWWRFGEHKYGARKALVESEDWEGPAFQTCVNASNVCAKFETNRRRLVVPFSHHAEVASLPIAEADQLLDWCESEFNNHGRVPTIKALRERVKEVKAWLSQGWTQSQLDRRNRVEQGITVVASKRKGKDDKELDAALIAWADQQGKMVLIDRHSDWGNPFEIPADGDRDTVCDNYAQHYLPYKQSLLKKVGDLKGKVLVCWCHPDRCHGDHLAEIANR